MKNDFSKAADAYSRFAMGPTANEEDLVKYAFALFLNHDFAKSLEVANMGLKKNPRHAAFNRLAMYNNTDLKRFEEALKAADVFFNECDKADYSYLDYMYYGHLLEELKKYDEENIYIIGGESIYRQMLPYCDVAHVTKIDHAYEADAYFPDLDSDPEWEITADSDEQVYFDITYQFLKYERKKS